MNPRLTIRRHSRKIAGFGALVAVSATTTMALVAGTAAAAAPPATQPGTCIDNVNVRAEPSIDSRIVAVCETGTAVQVAETQDGFVHLTDLHGWAAQEYVSVNGATPPAPADRAAAAPAADTTPAATTTTPAPHAQYTPSPSGDEVNPPETTTPASGTGTGTTGTGTDTGNTGTDATGTGGTNPGPAGSLPVGLLG